MRPFDVYPRYLIEPVRGEGCYVFDKEGNKYLDLYGGHAVISIGHSHPHFVSRIKEQLDQLAFYSNSVQMPVQDELAKKLGQLSRLPDYQLFLCNSGAEANENALKLASFHTKRMKVIVFEKGFHGRTSLAVEATDNPKIHALINCTGNFIRLPLNDKEQLIRHLNEEVAAVIVEGLQGIAGIYEPETEFLELIAAKCKEAGALLILDEIQSGYGRSGEFFAHQQAKIQPDIITVAKGMGNGFPIGGVLISPEIKPWHGMLGTTFGGNHLACAAGLAVLEVLENENLIQNAHELGEYLIPQLQAVDGVKEVRGRGLMIGIETNVPAKEIREKLLFEHHIFTGSSGNPNTIRLLPPLSIQKEQVDHFTQSFKTALA
ncbi:MAG: aminotransferase class III-fold pyridoxal phosphate-dependent enzyme [Bacteroidota bacterium]